MQIKDQTSLTRKTLYGIMLLAIFLSAFSAGNLPSARAQESSAVILSGAIVSISADQASFGVADDVILHVTITNPNDYSIGILNWLTPADGVGGPLFTVARDGEPVAYIGMFAKRAAPTEQDYINLAVGESLTRDVNLSTYYDLSVSGNYAIKYNIVSVDLYAREDGRQFDNILVSNMLELFIEGRAKPKLHEVLPQIASDNSFAGCDASQQTDIVSARDAANIYAANAAADFTANVQGLRYTTWFGVYDAGRYSTVASHYTAVQNAMDGANPITFDCTCPSYSGDPTVFAYVYPDSPYYIYLCGAFWGAPTTGTNSKAGTLIHETTHFDIVAGTQDYAYGTADAQLLAINMPDLAIMNADSHEYFAENNPILDPHSSTLTVINTNDDGTGSLRNAIASAWVGDTIIFDASLSGGTIHLLSPLTLSKDVTIDGSALASRITISGGDGVRVFINSGVTTLNSLIITKGSNFFSGGIENSGTLTVTNSILTGNSSASGKGGGIDNSGTLTVTNSTLSGNYASLDGGGINNQTGSALTVINSTLSGNSSDYGGGIENSGTLTITNSTLSGNSAGNGGGIDNDGVVTVTNSTLSGNSAMQGGGLNNVGGTLTVTNSTLSGNSATLGGGGIHNQYDGILTATNSTLSGNSAAYYGGGIYNELGSVLNYANSIIANSTSGGDCFNEIDSTIGTNINNLVEDGSCFASLSGDPKLDALANNSGPTKTLALLTGSKAIDAGNDAICAAAPVSNTSQNGVTRPRGAHCDIGSFEFKDTTSIFTDVPSNYWASSFIERLYNAGITGGCSVIPLNYCPDATVTRAQMAVFLLKGMHGSNYTPPTVGASTGFTDVPVGYWAAAWIKQLAAEGITGGCGSGNYCPDITVTRAQMAVFLLKAKHGSSYSPPAATGVFTDVPVGYWADKWIEQLASEGITGGCSTGVYCPDSSVTRAQMAVFLVKAFNLP